MCNNLLFCSEIFFFSFSQESFVLYFSPPHPISQRKNFRSDIEFMSKIWGVFIPRMGNYKNALLSDSYGIRNKFRFSFLKGPWDKKLRPKINDENKQQTPKNRMLGNDYDIKNCATILWHCLFRILKSIYTLF